MTKLNSTQVLDYLDELHRSLKLSPEQAREIVDEVRADLSAHIGRHVDEGADEATAIARAIETMGEPAELAKQIKATVPPHGSATTRTFRRLITIAMAALFVWIFWNIRAMSYGLSIGGCLSCVIAMTLLLLIRPDVIWRKNWMFSVFPTLIVLAVVSLVMLAGRETSTTISLDNPAAVSTDQPSYDTGYIALGLLAVLAVYLLGMIQQTRQRTIAMVVIALVTATIELPYAMEEHRYASGLAVAQQQLEDTRNGNGELPDPQLLSSFFGANRFHCIVHPSGEHYSLFWNRPLNPAYALCYSDDGDRMWIND